MNAAPLPHGARLGPYELLDVIGAGGMGEVYRARDPRLGREVAVKTLPVDFVRDPARRRRFDREVRAAASVDHPGVLAVLDTGIDGDTPWVATELLDQDVRRQDADDLPLPSRRAEAISQ